MIHRNDKPRSAAERHAAWLYRMTIASAAGCALMLGGLAYGTVKDDLARTATPAGGWRIVQYYKGAAFTLDRGLSHNDCDDALPRNQAAKGLSFACELER